MAHSNKKARHILALSGGKDSAALAVYMRDRYPDLELEYVFTDSGCELPETYEYLDRIRAVLNIDITVIKPKKSWENYWSLVKVKKTKHGNFTYLPTPKNRWCTEVLKLNPYDDWLLKKYPGEKINSYVGLRADEPERKGFISAKANVDSHYPFKEDGYVYNDIKNLLNDSGLGFPSYYKWRSRSGCYFCFYQTKKEWLGLFKNHPELYRKASSYETVIPEDNIKFTWCEDISLEELALQKEEILLNKSNLGKHGGKTALKLSEIFSKLF